MFGQADILTSKRYAHVLHITLCAFLTYSSLPLYVLLRSVSRRKPEFPVSFPETLTQTRRFLQSEVISDSWMAPASHHFFTGISFTGIHERDPVIKIYLYPVSQIQFPTKGTNVASWLQIKSVKTVQVKISSFTCYLTFFIFNKHLK